jgi:hypothetical protein
MVLWWLQDLGLVLVVKARTRAVLLTALEGATREKVVELKRE